VVLAQRMKANLVERALRRESGGPDLTVGSLAMGVEVSAT
jgi:hypothetical protein